MTLQLQKRKEKENNREYAYRILHDNIMTLQLPPGTVLNEGELAEIFETSRTPIHEAILQLKTEHLVEVLPQSASKVSLIDMEIMKEGLFLRTLVEPALVKTIAGQIHSDRLEPLRQNLEVQKILVKQVNSHEETIDSYLKLDDEFHHIIYNLANKPKTWFSVKSLSSHYDRIRYFDAILNKKDINTFYKNHKTIYHTIQVGIFDESAFELSYHKHLKGSLENFEDLKEQYAHYFSI